MIRKLTLVAGFGAGYILGAKAGTQRYDQIMGKFHELAGKPAVQDVKETLVDTASTLGEKAKDTVTDKVSAVGDKVTGGTSDVVDLASASNGTATGNGKATTRTGARTAAAPMPGAAPSITAPDA